MAKRSIDEKFWAKVVKTTTCWIWTGANNGVGYGKVRRPLLSAQSIYAHRYAWFLKFGRWPNYLCHRCDNRACVNPSHVYEGTPKTNQQDRIKAGNGNEGSKHPLSKLTEANVREIRKLISNGLGLTAVAAKFGVAPSTICHITHGRTWGHI